jgi:hypothetical protein
MMTDEHSRIQPDEHPRIERDDDRPGHTTPLLIGLRYVLPAAVVLAGVIVMAFGSEVDLEGGAGIVSAGLAICAMSWLYRASVDGDRVREEEDAARTYFDIHGRWPDEGTRRVDDEGTRRVD